MRTIKFRAKRIPDQTWVYGDLTHCLRVTVDADIPCIRIAGYDCNETTIGQFTGLYDKNGKEIYEGDIVKTKMFGKDVNINGRFVNVSGYDTFEIKYVNAQFVFNNGNRWFYLHRNTFCEIIGNIHDNPELLKQ